MSKVGLLAGYKLKSFFSPSYKGRFGPLPLIGLALVFIPSGLSMGFVMGGMLLDADAEFAINLLGSALSAMMIFGFVFALGVGITAQPSELDFIMTAPVRPREYLIADMIFQFGSVTVAGGMAILAAVFGLLQGAGQSLWLAVPIILILCAYAVMIFLTVQILTVLRIRHPRLHVKTIVLFLLVLSVLPMVSIAVEDFPLAFSDMPIPMSAFAILLQEVLSGSAIDLIQAGIASAYFALVAGIWSRVSGLYFFHGVKPTLSAGFGQVDMASKMAQQKRMIGGFGRFTTKVGFRTEVGGELSLMTRLNLARFWRDGSFLFVALLLAIFLGTGVMQSGADDSSPIVINLFQAGAWPIAILALNWCYLERDNLWIPVVSGRSLVTYFQGLMMSLLLVGAGIAAIILVVLVLMGVDLSAADLALVISNPAADAAIATMILTRIRVKPGAFSPGMLGVLFATILLGAGVSGSLWLLVSLIGDSTSLLFAAQLATGLGVTMFVCALGFLAVTRLARGFRFG